MLKIGLLSDTHGFLDTKIKEVFKDVDEIWHAGDAGSIDVITGLEAFRPLRAVWGNCDDFKVRSATKEYLFFMAGNKRVLIIHIGGYPGKYNPNIKAEMNTNPPKLFKSCLIWEAVKPVILLNS